MIRQKGEEKNREGKKRRERWKLTVKENKEIDLGPAATDT
jgi:hypothetical protein